MSRIFISHSSANNLQAVAVGAWLSTHSDNGWDDYFLDLDPERGLKAGQRWQEQLRVKGERCEAVIFLISTAWLRSKWCLAEFLLAKQLNKKIFGVLIEAVPIADIPVEMAAEWQLCNLAGTGETEAIECLLDGKQQIVEFSRDGLARLRDGLTQAGIDPRTFTFPPGRDPYRGLKPLEADDAAVFFGRGAQILHALDSIRGMRNAGSAKLMVIRGASGAGKSSFLRAGLLPRLRRDDRNFFVLAPIRPIGESLSGEQGLAASLESGFTAFKDVRTRGKLIDDLKKADGALVTAVLDLQQKATERVVDPGKPVTVVLPIDQGEELLDGHDEPRRLLTLLMDAFDNSRLDPGSFIAIITIRSDRFEGLQEGLQNDSRHRRMAVTEFSLPPIPMTSYRQIIERPAEVFERSGGKLDLNPDFVEAIAADAAKGGADALPLLAFTLERLYSLYGKDGNLTLGEYQTLGRMEGAIAVAVNGAVGKDETEKLRPVFIPHLAVVDPKTLEPRRVKAKLAKLPHEAQPLIEKMVATHLLIRDKTDEGIVVELAHDSLLGAWSDLRGWLKEDQNLLALRATVQEAAQAWKARKRNRDRLTHHGTALKEAEALLDRPDLIDDLTKKYLKACRGREGRAEKEKASSIERERKQLAQTRRFQRYAAVALLIGLALVVFGGWLVIALTGSALDTRARIIADAAMNRSTDHFDSSLRLALLAAMTAKRSPIQSSANATMQEVVRLGSVSEDGNPGLALSHSALVRALQGTQQTATLRGHSDAVLKVAFSPDGKFIVTASEDNTARLWDVDGGLRAVLAGHTGIIWSAVFSPDGGRIVTTSSDDTARLWNTKGEELAVLSGHEGTVWFAAFSPDSTLLVTTSSDDTARLWNVEGRELAVLKGHSNTVRSATYSSDGKRLLTASWDGTARLWDLQGNELAKFGHEDDVYSAVFNPDDSRVLTASADGTARLWDIHGKEIATLKGHAGSVRSADFAWDGGRIITASSDGTARLWDTEGREISILKGHLGPLSSAVFSRDGGLIATASYDNTARLWNLEGKELSVLRGHESTVNFATFSPDGKRILTGSDDKTARVWNTTGNEPIVLRGHEGLVSSATFSPDGSQIVTASSDLTARLWDMQGNELAAFRDDENAILFVAFSPDGTRILTTSKIAGLWDTRGHQLAVLRGHQNWVNAAAFSPDGRRIVTVSDDRSGKLWDLDGNELAVFEGHFSPIVSVAFSPDGNRIVTASWDKTARLWDTLGTELAVLTGHEDWVNSAVFSPDGHRILTASDDGTARLWSLEGNELIRFKGHDDYVRSAIFNSDGSRILTTSRDKTARLWNLQGKELAVLKGHLNDVISAVFSPDDSRIMTASFDDTARLWDPEGKELAVLRGHGRAVNSASFSPDGSHIVTASDDKTARLWDVSPATKMSFEFMAQKACRMYLNEGSEPSLEELRLVGLENEFATPPDLCAEYR